MIIDDKFIMLPPTPPGYIHTSRPATPLTPSYTSPQINPQPLSPGGSSRPKMNLTKLPIHILLQIITHTFPSSTPAPAFELLLRYYHREVATNPDTVPELARKTLYWLSTSLRLVSRQMYIATMFVLRSTYLDSYHRMIRPGYSCDPFPIEGSGIGDSLPTYSRGSTSTLTVDTGGSHQQIEGLPSFASSTSGSGLGSYSATTPPPLTSLTQPLSAHRETAILDRFIALKVRQDMFMDDSSLLMDREDAFRDLFEVAQPRARLEDLVRIIGSTEGLVMGFGGCGVPGSPMSVKRASLQPPPSPMSPAYSPSPPSYASSPGAGASSSSGQASAQPASNKKEKKSFFAALGFRLSTSSASHSSRTPPHPSPPPSPRPPRTIDPLPFSSLTVTFSPRTVGLVMNRHRTVVQVSRTSTGSREGRLEALATALVSGLKEVLSEED
ncbi:hypothetical protein BJ165DRAFT_1494915 [Panaeolus papilionaceus]|nr:hypothetical protein BJ165DRAFT_1494915 [Panaeolus papilionaceus]